MACARSIERIQGALEPYAKIGPLSKQLIGRERSDYTEASFCNPLQRASVYMAAIKKNVRLCLLQAVCSVQSAIGAQLAGLMRLPTW